MASLKLYHLEEGTYIRFILFFFTVYSAVCCSYGGMLSAWFRFKYPNVVDGALAASAPIYYIDNLSSNTGFYERVTQVSRYHAAFTPVPLPPPMHLRCPQDFASVDGRCPQYVRKGFSMIMELAKTGTKGIILYEPAWL